ncbi:MAG: GNAT family N-acetyltransferase [Thermomicrobiales bacterium]|nr:GNAT family N-acetyltransferase [Thermomicrobiales bacterium]MCO5222178.1 GNAT family N-acetyltransferase [Thermomicrobiales bacterium]
MTLPELSAPVPYRQEHDVTAFSCGDASLDRWIRSNAARNESNDASRTFVICSDSTVVAYYALAAGSIERAYVPKALQRNMPNPLPVIVLGRLAVDARYQDHGLGSGLLKDAMIRVALTSQTIGVKAILVHAISDDAQQWYLKRWFVESPLDPMTLLLPTAQIRKSLGIAGQ